MVVIIGWFGDCGVNVDDGLEVGDFVGCEKNFFVVVVRWVFENIYDV